MPAISVATRFGDTSQHRSSTPYPGFDALEIEALGMRTKSGERWRVLQVTFPLRNTQRTPARNTPTSARTGFSDDISTQSMFWAGLRAPITQFEYRAVDGVMLPTRRQRVCLQRLPRQKVAEPILVSIDLSEIQSPRKLASSSCPTFETSRPGIPSPRASTAKVWRRS